MILREVSVERFSFTCAGCGHSWMADWDVQHVTDTHGYDRDYYFRNGLPCPDPTAPGQWLCPACGRGRIAVQLTARRASPAITSAEPAGLGSRPRPATTAARATVPLLPVNSPAATSRPKPQEPVS